jgi:hypothetical protein
LKVRAVLKPGQTPADEEAIIDAEGHAHRAFEIDESAIVLVRPDNRIGLIARPVDAAALDRYFDRLHNAPGSSERPSPSLVSSA